MHKGVTILALVTGLALAACGGDVPVEPPSDTVPDQASPPVVEPPLAPLESPLPEVTLADASDVRVSGDIVSSCVAGGCMETERPVYDIFQFVLLPEGGSITLEIDGAAPTQVTLMLLPYQDGLAVFDAPVDSTTLSAPGTTVSWQPDVVPGDMYILDVRVEWDNDFATHWFPVWLPTITGRRPFSQSVGPGKAREIALAHAQSSSYLANIDTSRVSITFQHDIHAYSVDFAWKGAGQIRPGLWDTGYYVIVDASSGEMKEANAYVR